MTTATASLATVPQVSFLRDLLSKKDIDATRRTFIEGKLDSNTLLKSEASMAITILKSEKNLVRMTADAPRIDPKRKAVLDVLANIPHANYALPSDEIQGALVHTKVTGNDLLFVTIREYRGTLYMRRLHGAPGDFSKSMISVTDALTIARIIADKPARYALLFSQHHNVCAKCSANLTDQTSRELGLGPTCRKGFGL